MASANLFNTYHNHIQLDKVRDYCLRNGERAVYARGEEFVTQGKIGKYLAFIESGLFTYTTRKSSGEEAVCGFAFGGEYITDFNNSWMRRPSQVSIIAVKESVVYRLTNEQVKTFADTEFPDFYLEATNALYQMVYGRYIDLYRFTPAERYAMLLENYPDLFKEVPLQDIASFLLISPTHLSRIRKNIVKK